ncbi:MAG: arginase family protein, partial [Nanoarchaeota archaeon]
MQIVKVPGLNSFGRNDGCRNAADAIFSELKEIWSNSKNVPVDYKMFDMKEIELDNGDLDEQEKKIHEGALDFIKSNEKVIFIGGDHSITYSTGKAFLDFCRENGKEPCLIIFDSHPDCMPPQKNVSHEEWLRACVDYGFTAKNILFVGLRNSDIVEIKYMSENSIKQIKINDLMNDLEDVTDSIMEFSSGKELYVSFDIDFIDPAFAPSTGYIEAGGSTSWVALY